MLGIVALRGEAPLICKLRIADWAEATKFYWSFRQKRKQSDQFRCPWWKRSPILVTTTLCNFVFLVGLNGFSQARRQPLYKWPNRFVRAHIPLLKAGLPVSAEVFDAIFMRKRYV